MKTEKHTPGPWDTEPFPYGFTVSLDPLNAMRIYSTDPGTENEFTVGYSVDNDRQTRTANARLIAAAPDLLEACETAYHTLCEMTTEEFQRGADKPLRQLLFQAIAKARGPRLCDQPKSELFEQIASIVRPEGL